MKGIAKTTESVPIAAIGPDWHRRIVAGTWNARFISAAAEHLPRYSLSLICADPAYARQFLEVPRVSFNINQNVLMGPLGQGFIEEARAARRQIYVWTVDERNLMRWSIQHGVDGVVSNEPGRFHEVCDAWEKEHADGLKPAAKKIRVTVGQRMRILAIALYVKCFGWYYRRKFSSPLERVDFDQRKLG
jgi:phosphatidylglycerol phospholipase C